MRKAKTTEWDGGRGAPHQMKLSLTYASCGSNDPYSAPYRRVLHSRLYAACCHSPLSLSFSLSLLSLSTFVLCRALLTSSPHPFFFVLHLLLLALVVRLCDIFYANCAASTCCTCMQLFSVVVPSLYYTIV